jgi:hypothetical protein
MQQMLGVTNIDLALCMASMHSVEYNKTNTKTGTYIGDYLSDNDDILNENKTWSFELLQEMYIYMMAINPANYAKVPLLPVNITIIDSIIIEKKIKYSELEDQFVDQLIQYLGFTVGFGLEDNMINVDPQLSEILLTIKEKRF